jgi:outer membrane cobalamin receptor
LKAVLVTKPATVLVVGAYVVTRTVDDVTGGTEVVDAKDPDDPDSRVVAELLARVAAVVVW